MDRRRFLLTVGANKWLTYPFEFLYHSLIPTQINGSKVQDKAKLTKISGNGVIENQLADLGNIQINEPDYCSASVSNNVLTMTVIQAISSGTNVRFGTKITAGHKYFYAAKIKATVNNCKILFGLGFSEGYYTNISINQGETKLATLIVVANYNDTTSFVRFDGSHSAGSQIEVSELKCIDLALMFGTGNEPTTLTDNRIQALLNRGYIAYNTGEYKNSKVGEIETTTSNIFDSSTRVVDKILNDSGVEIYDGNSNYFTQKIKVQPNQKVFFGFQVQRIYKYDANGNWLGRVYAMISGVYTIPNDTYYIQIQVLLSAVDLTKLYINYGENDLGYQSYGKLSTITLNGLLELNGAINSHDTFEITNTDYVFTRNIGVVDLGSLSWEYNSSNTRFITRNATNMKALNGSDNLPNMACSLYLATTVNNFDQNTPNMAIRGHNTLTDWCAVRNTAYTDAPTFKTAMSGVMLYYELATPQVITIPKKHLGCVDLGSLNWARHSTDTNRFVSYDNINAKQPVGYYSTVSNAYCSIYKSATNAEVVNTSNDMVIGFTDSTSSYALIVRNSNYTNAADFKSAMAGVYLFYETQNEVSDFDNVAQINAGGSITANEFSANFEQVIANGDFTDTSAWSFFSGDSDNTFTVSGNIASIKMYSYGDKTIFRQQYTPVSGHKYLLVADYRVTTLTQGFSWVLGSNSVDFLFASTTWQRVVNIGTRTDANPTFGISLSVSRSIDFRLRNVKYIDLTETFGAGNEPTSENDYRVQYILNGGSLDAVAETEVLPNANFKIKCK